MASTLLSIQVIPKTPNGENSYPYVDRAIEVIQQSGLKYQVNALDTTMEGNWRNCWRLSARCTRYSWRLAAQASSPRSKSPIALLASAWIP